MLVFPDRMYVSMALNHGKLCETYRYDLTIFTYLRKSVTSNFFRGAFRNKFIGAADKIWRADRGTAGRGLASTQDPTSSAFSTRQEAAFGQSDFEREQRFLRTRPK